MRSSSLVLSTIRRRLAAASRDDAGLAMLTVIGVVTILFVLSTMLLSMAVYQIMSTARQEAQLKAMHAADAGLNAYLYELRRDPNYFVAHPTIGPIASGDGQWTVRAVPATGTVMLRSVGTIPGRDTSRTVMAQVRFPTFGDYMFLTNADINVGADAVITGKLHTNGNFNNAGICKGHVTAVGTVTGSTDSAHLQAGYTQHATPIDFATVTTDLTDMRTAATNAGHYFAASGSLGYRCTLSGVRYKVEKVTVVSSTGVLTTSLVRDWTNIPSNGVLFFSDNVWVLGDYAAMITIGSSKTAYIVGNLVPTTADTPYTCGIVTTNDIIVPTWYASLPDNMTVKAALLAQTGAVYGDLKYGYTKSTFTIWGSMAYSNYGYFASYSGGSVVAGFRSRSYNYDPRLDLYAPPMYPTLKTGSLKVTSWIEQ